MYERREIIEDETGFVVNVPCIDDLIKLKKTDRYKDSVDVQYLEKFKEMREKKIIKEE